MLNKDTRSSPLRVTRTRTNSQIKWLSVVARSRFAFGSWDGYLIIFLELAGKNSESIMIERWREERAVENVLENTTSKCKFRVLP